MFYEILPLGFIEEIGLFMFLENNVMAAEVLEIVEGMRFSYSLDDILKTVTNYTIKSLPKGTCKITVKVTARNDNFINNVSLRHLYFLKMFLTKRSIA